MSHGTPNTLPKPKFNGPSLVTSPNTGGVGTGVASAVVVGGVGSGVGAGDGAVWSGGQNSAEHIELPCVGGSGVGAAVSPAGVGGGTGVGGGNDSWSHGKSQSPGAKR